MTNVRRTCVFCEILAGNQTGFHIYRDERVAAFLDVRPLFEGHTLVVPIAHIERFTEMDDETLGMIVVLARDLAAAARIALGCSGVFVALNDTVSQSVPHVHVHVVPRRKGDGLRGFFWPRRRYSSDEQAREVASRIRAALTGVMAEGSYLVRERRRKPRNPKASQ